MIAIVSFFAHEPGAAINVPDLRALGQPHHFSSPCRLQDSACLLVKNQRPRLADRHGPRRSAAVRHGQAPAILRHQSPRRAHPRAAEHAGQRRRGTDRAAISSARRLSCPCWPAARRSGARCPIIADRCRRRRSNAGNADSPFESWAGPSGRGARTLRRTAPPPARTTARCSLLFHANGGTLLWAARLDATGQAELMQAFPDLRADVLVWGGDAAPDADWLRSLGMRFWLRLPPAPAIHERAHRDGIGSGVSHALAARTDRRGHRSFQRTAHRPASS